MATLKDIARHLGLSPATVSRALNGYPEVNARTRTLVETTAREMKYTPNQAARKLVSGRSGMIGLVIKEEAFGQPEPTFYDIMFGLSDELAQRDMDLVVHASSAPDPVAPYKRFVARQSLDAFIIFAPQLNDPRIEYLKEIGMPFVVHGRTPDASYPYFDLDNHAVSYDAVQLLGHLGHRRIALINGPEAYAFATDRRAGFNDAMHSLGCDVPAGFVAHGVNTSDFGYAASVAMLSGNNGARPTAILCASTVIAEGVYRAASDLGLRIPADLSVVAHEDVLRHGEAAPFVPDLSVTSSPLRDACAPLAAAIEAVLAGAPVAQSQTLAKAEMHPRASIGPVPAL